MKNTKNIFLKLKEKERFNPSFISIVKSDYLDRKILYRAIKGSSAMVTGRVLDIGCATKPYKKLFTYDSYIGIDIDDNPGHLHAIGDVDMYYDGVHIPFPDNHFDTIVCFQVIEHVRDLEKLLVEMNRVLKKGGKIIATFPFMWGLHELPHDYRRLTPEGAKKLFIDAGFSMVSYTKLGDNLSSFFQMILLYICDLVYPLWKPLKILVLMPFCVIANIAGILVSPVTMRSFYIENHIIIEK